MGSVPQKPQNAEVADEPLSRQNHIYGQRQKAKFHVNPTQFLKYFHFKISQIFIY